MQHQNKQTKNSFRSIRFYEIHKSSNKNVRKKTGQQKLNDKKILKCKLICLFISIYHDKNAFEEVFLFKKIIDQFLHKHEWISSLCHKNNAGCVWMAYIKYFMGQNTPSTFLRLNSFTSVRIPTKLFEKGEI